MITTPTQESNRRNALKSTGPRTDAGKRRSARNALQHGLTMASLADPSWAPEVAALVNRMISDEASPTLRECAYAVADAQIDLVRVMRARHHLISTMLRDENFEPKWQATKRAMVMQHRHQLPKESYERLMVGLSQKPKGEEKIVLVFCEIAADLTRLDRYARRALSRRRRAMRFFDAAAQQEPGSLPSLHPIASGMTIHENAT
ncbi:MAG TPA: hypothetical protein VHV77_02215 [Pirellulales bacterium]|jgi:hypothetical protein|nr:hypothetical protein [Pirellulales bacterium]